MIKLLKKKIGAVRSGAVNTPAGEMAGENTDRVEVVIPTSLNNEHVEKILRRRAPVYSIHRKTVDEEIKELCALVNYFAVPLTEEVLAAREVAKKISADDLRNRIIRELHDYDYTYQLYVIARVAVGKSYAAEQYWLNEADTKKRDLLTQCYMLAAAERTAVSG